MVLYRPSAGSRIFSREATTEFGDDQAAFQGHRKPCACKFTWRPVHVSDHEGMLGVPSCPDGDARGHQPDLFGFSQSAARRNCVRESLCKAENCCNMQQEDKHAQLLSQILCMFIQACFHAQGQQIKKAFTVGTIFPSQQPIPYACVFFH